MPAPRAGRRFSIFLALLLLWLPVLVPYSYPVVGFPGFLDWLFTILHSFAGWPLLLLSVLLILLLFLAIRVRRVSRYWFLPVSVLLVASGLAISGPFLNSHRVPGIQSGKADNVLRILHVNLYLYNPPSKLHHLASIIDTYEPDLMILHELDESHAAFLRGLDFPYAIFNTHRPYFGYGVLSRVPVKKTKEISNRLELLVELEVLAAALPAGVSAGEPDTLEPRRCAPEALRLLAAHPVAPFNPRILAVHRRAFLNMMAQVRFPEWESLRPGAAHSSPSAVFEYWSPGSLESKAARGDGSPLILVGDFNSVDWSRDMERLRQSTGLKQVLHRDPLQGLFRGTFSSHWPDFLRIPIDGVLVSERVNPVGFLRMEVDGSDHLGLMFDVELPLQEKCDSLKNFQRSRP